MRDNCKTIIGSCGHIAALTGLIWRRCWYSGNRKSSEGGAIGNGTQIKNFDGDGQMAGKAHEHFAPLSVSSVPASIHFFAKKHFVDWRECALERSSSVFIPLGRLGAFHSRREIR